MSKNIISLKSIITAITRSFSQAQEELCWSQLAALLEFFHDDGSPKTLKFNVPSFNENDNKSDEINTFQAPILSLIAPSPLHIADSKIEFNVAINELSYEENTSLTPKEKFLDLGGKDGDTYISEDNSIPFDMMVDTSIANSDVRGGIKIVMKVKSSSNQDGYERMLAKLAQLQVIDKKTNN